MSGPPIRATLAEIAAFIGRPRLTPDEVAALAAAAPRGDGSAILVLPSLFRPDRQTNNLRVMLSQAGYQSFGWTLGVNIGPTPRLMQGALRRVEDLAARNGPISVIGFSMGGLFARWLAIRATCHVRQIISIGSPMHAPLSSMFIPAPLQRAAWRGFDLAALANEIERPSPVQAISLYSRRDGIVTWQNCRSTNACTNNYEVSCHHVSMPQDKDVFRIVAACLASRDAPSHPAELQSA